MITDNRLEQNLPCFPCLGPDMVMDQVGVKYFDRVGSKWERMEQFTPFHTCCVLELCGQVHPTP